MDYTIISQFDRFNNGLRMIEMHETKTVYDHPKYVGTSIMVPIMLSTTAFRYNAIHKHLERKYNVL